MDAMRAQPIDLRLELLEGLFPVLLMPLGLLAVVAGGVAAAGLRMIYSRLPRARVSRFKRCAIRR
jgi:hypothetical protein